VKSLEYAQLANELLPPDELAIRAITLNLWGNALVHSGKDAEAIAILEQAFAIAVESNKMHLALIALGSISTAHLFAGRIREVHRICLEGVKLADEYQRRFQRTISAATDIYMQLARVLAEWGESEESIIIAQKALSLSLRWGRAASEVVSQQYLGRALVFANRWKEAREVFQRAEASSYKIESTAWRRALFYYLDSMLDSDEPNASEVARERRRAEECGMPLPAILKARLQLRDNRPDQALATLEGFLSSGSGHLAYDIVRVYALRALAYRAKGETQAALEWLRRTLEIAEPENRVMSIVREGPAMENLLRLAKSKGINPTFTQRLLSVFENRRATIIKPALIAQTLNEPVALIEPLSERELEVLQHLNSYLSTPEIADLLVVSANTVRTHIKNIYGKLGVHGRSSAVKRGRELGLIN
jgi:LuxR family maltose regulon positive regulatory protein